ncbi:MAG TPA: hypothetical protein VGE12_19125, partial [Noviherbaspirillum sp.]
TGANLGNGIRSLALSISHLPEGNDRVTAFTALEARATGLTGVQLRKVIGSLALSIQDLPENARLSAFMRLVGKTEGSTDANVIKARHKLGWYLHHLPEGNDRDTASKALKARPLPS